MKLECPTDTSDDITMNRQWICEQIDRLLAWEILCKVATHDELYSIKSSELCDKIGANEQYFYHFFHNIKGKLNAK